MMIHQTVLINVFLQELEKLTQVATAAFRSGTDSVELLKKQVASQRKELDEVKKNHKYVFFSYLLFHFCKLHIIIS